MGPAISTNRADYRKRLHATKRSIFSTKEWEAKKDATVRRVAKREAIARERAAARRERA